MSYVEDICLSLIGFALEFLSLFFYGFLVFISCFLYFNILNFSSCFLSGFLRFHFFFLHLNVWSICPICETNEAKIQLSFSPLSNKCASTSLIENHLFPTDLKRHLDDILISYIHLDLFQVSIFCSSYQSIPVPEVLCFI